MFRRCLWILSSPEGRVYRLLLSDVTPAQSCGRPGARRGPCSIPPAAPPAARRGFLVPPASAPAAAAAAADILRLSRSLVVAIVLSAVVVSPSLVIRTLIIDGVFGTTAHVTRVPVPVAAPAASAASAASLAPDVLLLVGSVGRFRGSAANVPVASLVLLLLPSWHYPCPA